jgi:hypothetical protein
LPEFSKPHCNFKWEIQGLAVLIETMIRLCGAVAFDSTVFKGFATLLKVAMAESNSVQPSTVCSLREISSQALEDLAVEPLQEQLFENNSPKLEGTLQLHEWRHMDSNTEKHGKGLPSTLRQLPWELLLYLGIITLSILLF